MDVLFDSVSIFDSLIQTFFKLSSLFVKKIKSMLIDFYQSRGAQKLEFKIKTIAFQLESESSSGIKPRRHVLE